MNRIVSILAFVLLLSSCSKSEDEAMDFSAPVINNLSYGNDTAQKMDLYFPTVRSKDTTLLAILIHGGSWTSGDKKELNQYIQQIRPFLPNFAFANINYRLVRSPDTKFPTQENDVRSAINFLVDRTDEMGISKKYILLGISAGGHLALLNAYKKNNQSGDPEAVINFFGPTDLADMYRNPINPATPLLLGAVVGAALPDNPNAYAQNSPVTFVNPQVPPTMIVQGGKDSLVAVSQSTILRDKLQQQNVPVQYVFYPDAGHGLTGTNLTDALQKVKEFLDLYAR
jgi:acetyl esterase/lipase